MRIFEFARVSDWDGRLSSLAKMAEPERWHNLHLASKNSYPILDRYVAHTFIRAYDQQKIIESGQVACFNTGLLTSGHEEIFALFTISEDYDRDKPISAANKKWRLKGWCRSGDLALTDFMEFPALTEYWSDPGHLVFDPKLQVQLNLDHIIRDNLNRFPEELGGRVDKSGRPTDLSEDAEDEDDDPVAYSERSIPVAARNALEGAVKQSIRLAQRSYRIAVPQFYRGKVQLLLPLYMRDADQPDLALTLERHGG